MRYTVECCACSRCYQAVFTSSAPLALTKEREPGDDPARLSKKVDQDSINHRQVSQAVALITGRWATCFCDNDRRHGVAYGARFSNRQGVSCFIYHPPCPCKGA